MPTAGLPCNVMMDGVRLLENMKGVERCGCGFEYYQVYHFSGYTELLFDNVSM